MVHSADAMTANRNLPRLLQNPRPAHLVLKDGTSFAGWAAGAAAVVEGEVVFNTSMTGYQEMLTDPSYHGQILTLTTSHVGQVGVNRDDAESDRIWARALVVQDLDLEPSSWRAEGGFEQWLEQNGSGCRLGLRYPRHRPPRPHSGRGPGPADHRRHATR